MHIRNKSPWIRLPIAAVAALVSFSCQQEAARDVPTPTEEATGAEEAGNDPLAARSDISNYARINESIVAAGQPEAGAWGAIRDAGITTVINLRTEEEGALDEAPLVEASGMAYVNIPIDSNGFDNESFEAVRRAVDDAGGPVMIHCASSNRVGAYWYLHLVADGASPEAAMAEAERAGLRSERLREQVLALADGLEDDP